MTTTFAPSGMQGPVEGLDYHVALAYYPEGSSVARWDVALWDDASAVFPDPPPLDDVSANVTELRIVRGRDKPLDRFRPGALTFTLFDPDGAYSPWNTAPTPTEPNAIRPGIEVVVWIDDGTTTYPRFRGVVDSITDRFPNPTIPEAHSVVFSAFDPLSVVAAYDGFQQSAAGAGELAGQRITRILASASYTGARSLEAGTIPLQATTLAKNALDEIGLTTDTDLGAFYADRSGVLVYRDRNGLATDSHYTASQATFGEVDPEICYADVVLADDLSKIRNLVTVAPDGGSAVTVADQTSIGLYQTRTFRRLDLIHQNASDSTVIANAHLTTYAYAEHRIEGLTVDLTQITAAQRLTVLALDLLYRITVLRRAVGFQVVADLQVEAIGEAVTAHTWEMTLNTFDAATVFDVARWNVDLWDSGVWGY